MNQRRDDEDLLGGALGAYTLGGPALAGGYLIANALREDTRDRDLGPAPIGSDPWLLRELTSAIAKGHSTQADRVRITVLEAVVTLRVALPAEKAAAIEQTARKVEGIKRLVLELGPAGGDLSGR